MPAARNRLYKPEKAQMRFLPRIGLPFAYRVFLPIATVALIAGAVVAFGPPDISGAAKLLGAAKLFGSTTEPVLVPVPFSQEGVVPVPSSLTQSDAAGRSLPAGGWTDGGLTLAFRAESDNLGALEPEVELLRVDEPEDPVRLFGPRFDVQSGENLYRASVKLKGLRPGEYIWRARFIQSVTGQASEWSPFSRAERAFGVVGDLPRVTSAYVEGGRQRADKPTLVGMKDDVPFRLRTIATPAASLARHVYVINREEVAPAAPPADASELGPYVTTIPVGEREDGWWYLHVWPIDQLGRVGPSTTASVSVLRTPPQVYDLAYRTLPTTPPYQELPIRFKLSQASAVNVSILPTDADGALRTFDLGQREGDAEVSLVWDGRDAGGKLVPVGGYSFSVHAVDEAGNPSDTRIDGLIISDRVIRVSLGSQSMTAWEGDNVVLSTLVTTGGQQLPTPTGNFEILSKHSPFTFRSPWPPGSPYWYPSAPVRMAMLFSLEHETFIHDNGARSIFGPGTNGWAAPGTMYGGSHGCVNVPTGAMYQFFAWADTGTAVVVQW